MQMWPSGCLGTWPKDGKDFLPHYSHTQAQLSPFEVTCILSMECASLNKPAFTLL